VFENRELRRIFGTKRDDMTEGWRKLHSEELHNRPKRMRWAGHVARIGAKRNAYWILLERQKERDH
jgi:hypothetical protein